MMGRWKGKNVLLCGIAVCFTLGPLGILYLHNMPQHVRRAIPEGLSDADTQRDRNGHALMGDFVSTRRERRLIMQDACRNSTQNSKRLTRNQLDHIIVSEQYKTLFCFVPKVACSQWKKVFLMMSGNVSDHAKLNEYSVHFVYGHLLRYLDQYTMKDIKQKIKHYKKIVMVRNPLDRLLSAFKNKFHGTGFKDPAYSNIAKHVVRHYRKDFKEPVIGNDVTFFEFVKYVTDDNVGQRNEHWRTFMELCAPCQIDYDFIGKYETINEDAEFIMSQMAPHIEFPAKPAAYGSSNTSESLPNYLSQIPLEYVGKLWDIYKDDFTFFNYSFLRHVNDISYLV